MSRSPTFTVLWSTSTGCWAVTKPLRPRVNAMDVSSVRGEREFVVRNTIATPSRGVVASRLLDVRDAGVVRRARTGGRPKEPAFAVDDRDVVDAGLATPHQALIIEL